MFYSFTVFTIVWTIFISSKLSIQWNVYFLWVSHIRETGENAALQRSAMFIENGIPTFLHSSGVLCASPTYRSAGAEVSVCNVAINILLRWSKEGFRYVRWS